jgi:transcriptional regulator with XRE-family HTH domain
MPSFTLREKLGKAVRRLRTDAGYSQESFADACHLHRTYIGSVERGEVNISLDNIEQIARTLRVPVSKLFVEAEQGR